MCSYRETSSYKDVAKPLFGLSRNAPSLNVCVTSFRKAPVIENGQLDGGHAPRLAQIKPGHQPKGVHFILPSKKDFVVNAWLIGLPTHSTPHSAMSSSILNRSGINSVVTLVKVKL